MREARRALFLDVILPLGALVSEELGEKLDANISLDFNRSQYRDYQRLSRSLKTFHRRRRIAGPSLFSSGY